MNNQRVKQYKKEFLEVFDRKPQDQDEWRRWKKMRSRSSDKTLSFEQIYRLKNAYAKVVAMKERAIERAEENRKNELSNLIVDKRADRKYIIIILFIIGAAIVWFATVFVLLLSYGK